MGATSSVSYQNEQIGAEILGDLHENRETLVRVHDKLDDISDNMSIGSKFLRQMTFRLYQNIVILIIIILVELALMGLIIYLKVK
ncbi:MAG: hypothetical protein Q8P67_17945 [archaeon]|nr:hypothetical protein [archaeon]